MASNSNDDNPSNGNNDNSTITIQLTVTSAQGAPRVPLTIDTSISAQELRATAANATHIPLDSLKLIFRGRLIAPGDSSHGAAVTEFKLEDGSVVHCMGKPATTTTTTIAAAGDHATATTTAPAPSLPTVSVPSNTAPRTTTTTTTSPPAVTDPLAIALQNLRTANPPDVYQTAITTLRKILQNITTHPQDAKYRSLKVDNAAFQRRLGGVAGGDAALRACGFQVEPDAADGTRTYVLPAHGEAWPALQQAARTVQAAAALASFTTAASNNSSSGVSSLLNPNNNSNMGAGGGAAAAAGGMWPNAGLGAGGVPPPGMLNSEEMQQMATQMMTNPQALQAMVQDPMVLSMIRNDPRFANDPRVQQMIQELGNNPQLAQMMSQLISNPQALAQMRALEQQYDGAGPSDPAQMAQILQGMMAANGGGGRNPPTSITGTRSSGANMSNNHRPSSSRGTALGAGNSGTTDEDLTEEEMIAEAIRRSLQDGNNGGGGGF